MNRTCSVSYNMQYVYVKSYMAGEPTKAQNEEREREGGGGVRSARWPVGLQPSGATHAAVLGLWYWILAPTFVAKF